MFDVTPITVTVDAKWQPAFIGRRFQEMAVDMDGYEFRTWSRRIGMKVFTFIRVEHSDRTTFMVLDYDTQVRLHKIVIPVHTNLHEE